LLRQPAVAAVLASPARARPLVRVPIPADLGVGGNLGFGLLTSDATLRVQSRSGEVIKTEGYPGPPSHRECAGGTSIISYAFPSS
jgi:hypothetical protein